MSKSGWKKGKQVVWGELVWGGNEIVWDAVLVGVCNSFVWGDLLRNENLPSWLFREFWKCPMNPTRW